MAATTTTTTTTTAKPATVSVNVKGTVTQVDAATADQLSKGQTVQNAKSADGKDLGLVSPSNITTPAAPVQPPTTTSSNPTTPPEGAPVDLSKAPKAEGDQLGIDKGALGTTTPGGMPRDTDEILSSGLLTPAQLDQAKLENINNLFTCPGCSDTQKQEMALYLQRYVLDGFIRGVDVPAMILKGDDEPIRFSFQSGGLSGVADTGGGPSVTLRGWENYDDGWRMQLFYHEVAHNILERPHNSNSDSLMWSQTGGAGTLQSPTKIRGERYDYMVGELFNPDNWKKTAAGGNAKPTADQLKGYPTITGEQIKTPSGTPVPQGGPSKDNWPTGGGGGGGGTGYSPSYTPSRSPGPSYSPIPTYSPGPGFDQNYYQGPSTQMDSGMGGGLPKVEGMSPLQVGAMMGFSLPQVMSMLTPKDLMDLPSNEFSQLLKSLNQLGQTNPMLADLAGFLAKQKKEPPKTEKPVKAAKSS